ncbi:dihydroorotase [Domibacillus enclensis]|uniref:Dihydroorotase n=1 Tax=Domibacillus enclensis TaxID=1017273 RepID=A0A1N6UC60_9BACI|nr:dihydroorotase [Domibacillus enclensis]OXS78489.1 dihydroorotase [Domibacillus enclensis]SIQ63202.1 dihydroorotase [Domibacillus enclensis]
MNWLIKNGQLLNENGELSQADIRITNGVIAEIGRELKADGEELLDASGKFVAPGLVDLHVHLREPGGEHKETIETGTKAAAKGGFTTIAAMPNTRPVPDTEENLQKVNGLIEQNAHIRVLPYASITIRQAGKELVDFDTLKENSAFAFTDDGVGIQEAGMMHAAMKKAAAVDMAIVAHCEDNSLIYGGAVHDGEYAKREGLPGIPAICESVQIARDVLLAENAGCHYHVCHVSTKESVRVIRDAKKAGIRVTGEVSPHHLVLTDMDIPGQDPNFKMNPPLRGAEDKAALIEGLLDGTLDFIATDHAPHTAEEKAAGIQKAPFGITGFETAFPLLYTELVQKGVITLKQLVDWMTIKPAETFNLPYGRLEKEAKADITIIDLEAEKEVNPETFLSKGKNTPFAGRTLAGWPAATFFEGKLVWQEGTIN